jgi:hypothetical protein
LPSLVPDAVPGDVNGIERASVADDVRLIILSLRKKGVNRNYVLFSLQKSPCL